MAYPQTDIYTGTSVKDGSGNVTSLEVVGGRFVEVQPIDNSGTVFTLLNSWNTKGIQLLSELPDGTSYLKQGHCGSVWDESRKLLWMFGADTHTSAMHNSVWAWSCNTGKVYKYTVEDPPSGYHVTTDGYPYATSNNNTPWAMHTFRCIWYDDTTKEFGVAMNSFEHSGITPRFDGSTYDMYSGKTPMWFFNTVTGSWRMWDGGSTSDFNKTSVMGAPVTYHKGTGWIRWIAPYADKLSETGVRSNTLLWGKMQAGIQQFAHKFGNKVVLIAGDSGDVNFFSKHDITDLDNSSIKYTIADFPLLSGWSLKNLNSALDPVSGKVVFLARNTSTTELRVFILDWNKTTPTVEDSGYSFGTSISADSRYQLKAEWSTTFNCALFILSIVGAGGADRVYGVRI